MAVGGSAYLVSSHTRSRVVAFPELGMEAVYDLKKDIPSPLPSMPRRSVHTTGLPSGSRLGDSVA